MKIEVLPLKSNALKVRALHKINSQFTKFKQMKTKVSIASLKQKSKKLEKQIIFPHIKFGRMLSLKTSGLNPE